jgi:type II restriction/modification system DNA methylase subunit YeeA
MASLLISEVRTRLQKFSIDHANDTDEKQNAQQFWRDFYSCFGLTQSSASMFEARVIKISGKKGYIDSFIPSLLLVEHKSAGEDLEKAYDQAQEYFHAIKNEFDKPKYIIVSDFKNIHLYDIRKDPKKPNICKLDELFKYADWFMFLAEKEVEEIIEETPVNRKATFQISKLHDQLLENNYIGRDLEIFLTRLVFCLFAEDTGLFGEDNQFQKLIAHTNEDGSDTGQTINLLFQVLNTPHNERQTNLDDLFKKFEYVNGSLFEEQIKTPFFNSELRKILLDCTKLDWSDISPAIFGSMFQAILENNDCDYKKIDKRRELGAHYTSERNILKVIQPLFLNALRKEFEEARSFQQISRIKALYEKLPSLKFLDPACGCGNFLIITYKELRNLENEIIQELFFKGQQGGLLDISTLCKVNISQFYGIEIDEAAAHIARVALYISDHQLNIKSARFGSTRPSVPLISTPHIVHENAIRFDWNILLPAEGCFVVMGNPPFIGKRLQTKSQKEDLLDAFKGIKNCADLDYICCWYIKAAFYAQRNRLIDFAFVSTSSITQGEQPAILWDALSKQNVHYNFAYQTFRWSNEGKNVAAVHCVIIGFGLQEKKSKFIFTYNSLEKTNKINLVKQINPYLLDAPILALKARNKPICNVPSIFFGNMPNDGGNYLFSKEEKDQFIKDEPGAEIFIRKFLGADEFINGTERYCLWLKDADPHDLSKLPKVIERIEAVRQLRLSSSAKPTIESAKRAKEFFNTPQPTKGQYILIPLHSSENREYIPMGFFDSEVICGNSNSLMPEATLLHFSILMSRMHMAWIRIVCGRLESRYRYSNTIVYNNFIWPETDKSLVFALEESAKGIINARKLYPKANLAELYNPSIMPRELNDAHIFNNKVVDKAYGYLGENNDTSRSAFLFSLYEGITKVD